MARDEGTRVSDDIQRLLKYIVHHFTAPEEAKDIEREATSAELASSIVASQRRALREEEQRAAVLAEALRKGLQRADAARRAGGNAISLDDRLPDENQIADAMVHFLVGTGMATSVTRETEPLHYIYTIAVDWGQLNSVALQARVSLNAVIGHKD